MISSVNCRKTRRQVKIREVLKAAEDERRRRERAGGKGSIMPKLRYVNRKVKFCQECGTKLGALGVLAGVV